MARSIADAESDTITKYALWDTGGNGHWVVNGVVQATNAEIDVTAAQWAQTVYQSGSGGTDQLYVRANDGTLWGAWVPFSITGTVDQVPVVNALNKLTVTGQSLAASSLVTVTDAESDTITQYALWDVQGNGHWVVNGVVQVTNAEIDVTAAQWAQTVYQSGSGGTDQLYVRANDGTLWGAWQGFTVNTVSPSIISSGSTLELASPFAGTVTFASNSGTLKLDNSTSFQGTVAGMAGTDAIDFSFINFATIQTPTYSGTGSGGTLSVTDGTHTADIALLGNYLASTFVASSDGHGGTSVVDPPAANQNDPLAQAQHG